MRYNLFYILILIVLSSCQNDINLKNEKHSNELSLTKSVASKKNEIRKDTLKNTTISEETPNTAPSINNDSLRIYHYPDLTIWGVLSIKTKNKKIVEIEATHNAELGFTKKVFFYKNEKLTRIKYVGHHAEWGKYKKDYPQDQYEWDSEKMTYFDSTFTFELDENKKIKSKKVRSLKMDESSIMDFVKKEKLNEL